MWNWPTTICLAQLGTAVFVTPGYVMNMMTEKIIIWEVEWLLMNCDLIINVWWQSRSRRLRSGQDDSNKH